MKITFEYDPRFVVKIIDFTALNEKIASEVFPMENYLPVGWRHFAVCTWIQEQTELEGWNAIPLTHGTQGDKSAISLYAPEGKPFTETVAVDAVAHVLIPLQKAFGFEPSEMIREMKENIAGIQKKIERLEEEKPEDYQNLISALDRSKSVLEKGTLFLRNVIKAVEKKQSADNTSKLFGSVTQEEKAAATPAQATGITAFI